MLINLEKNLCIGLHAKAASRWLENIFKRRGFTEIGARHEGPRNLTQLLGLPIEDEWWARDPMSVDYCFVVRKHPDALFSWWSTFKGALPHADQERVCVTFLQEWPRQFSRLFPCSTRLWRFVWDMPNASILRFETLTKDVDRYLDHHGLEKLEVWETARDPAHITPGKPPGTWEQYFNDESMDFLRERYRAEAEFLGYHF